MHEQDLAVVGGDPAETTLLVEPADRPAACPVLEIGPPHIEVAHLLDRARPGAVRQGGLALAAAFHAVRARRNTLSAMPALSDAAGRRLRAYQHESQRLADPMQPYLTAAQRKLLQRAGGV